MQPVYTGKRILGTIRLAEHQQSLANNRRGYPHRYLLSDGSAILEYGRPP